MAATSPCKAFDVEFESVSVLVGYLRERTTTSGVHPLPSAATRTFWHVACLPLPDVKLVSQLVFFFSRVRLLFDASNLTKDFDLVLSYMCHFSE